MAKSPIYFDYPESNSKSKIQKEETKGFEKNPFEPYPVEAPKDLNPFGPISNSLAYSVFEENEECFEKKNALDKEKAYALRFDKKRKIENNESKTMNVKETRISQLLMDAVRQTNLTQEINTIGIVDKNKILDNVKRTLNGQGIDFDEDLLESQWTLVTQKETQKPLKKMGVKVESRFWQEAKKIKRMVFFGASSPLKPLEIYCEKPLIENYILSPPIDLQKELEKEIRRKYVVCVVQSLLLIAVCATLFGLMGAHFQSIISKSWSWETFFKSSLYGAFLPSGFVGGNIFSTFTKIKNAKKLLCNLKNDTWDEDTNRWFAARCLSTDMHYENSCPFRPHYKCLFLDNNESLKNFYHRNKKECAVQEKKLFKQLVKIMERYAEEKTIKILERWLTQSPEKVMWGDLQEMWRLDKNLSKAYSENFKEEYGKLVQLAEEAFERETKMADETSPPPSRLLNLL